MIKTTIAESAYENTIQTFVRNQTGRRATNAQEDIISLFTMRHLFQLIPLGILKPHHIQTPEVLGHWAETQASTLNIQQVRNVPSTGFPDAFVDIHVISRKSSRTNSKENCFGWYCMSWANFPIKETNLLRTEQLT